MAGTTIKGVGNDGNVQIRDMVTAAKQNAGTGFQAVWNKTQNNAQTTGNGGRTTDGCNDVRRGEALRTGDRQRDNLTGTQEKSDVKAEDSDAKDLEKVQEVLGTIVQNLIGQIKETFSVSEFQKEVRHYIDTIDMPIVVGGTGLYIKGALYDYTFEETESKHDEIKAKYAHYTNEELHQYLASFDPQSAQDLHPNNRQRVLRAIEIYEESGKRKSDILEAQEHKPVYDIYFVGLTLPRPVLYERINKRVDLMIEQGLEEEVRTIYDSGLSRDAQSMKAIGYKEWFDYFEGLKSKEEIIEVRAGK